MAFVLDDRVKETSTTTGTGTLTLAGAVTGFQAFSEIGDGNTTFYVIAHQTANEWEVGIGTYTLAGTTLSRAVLTSSNSDAAVDFSAGTKDVFVSQPASRAVTQDDDKNVGVGAANPFRKFHIFDEGVDGDARLYIEATPGDTGPGIELAFDATATVRALIRVDEVGASGTQLAFFAKPTGGSIDEFMRLNDSGGLSLGATFVATDPGTGKMIIQTGLGIGTTSLTAGLTMGNDLLISRDTNSGLTASVTQTQGQGALTAEINEVATVANVDDTVTLITAAAGLKQTIINNGANQLQIFPASGDNLGQGADTAVSLAAGSNITFVAYDATNWESV